MPKVTASPHITATPQPSMALAKTAAATAPSPTRMTTNVPMNSARQAPASGVASREEIGCSATSTGSTAAADFDTPHLSSLKVFFHEFQQPPFGAPRKARPSGIQNRRRARRVGFAPAVRPARQIPYQIGSRYAGFFVRGRR